MVAQKANEAGMVDGIFNFLEKNSLTSYVSSIKEVTMDNEEKKLDHLRQQVEQARVESEKIYQENKILQEKIDDANRKREVSELLQFCSNDAEREIVNNSSDDPSTTAIKLLAKKCDTEKVLRKAVESEDIKVRSNNPNNDLTAADPQEKFNDYLIAFASTRAGTHKIKNGGE